MEQIAYLLHLAATHQLDGWTLFPTGDETAALIARITALYHRFPLPDFAVIEAPCDQCETVEESP